MGAQLLAAQRQRLDRARQRMGLAAARLDLLSPLSVLGRGYSLTERVDGEDRRLMRRAADAQVGDTLETRLGDGATITSRIEHIEEGPTT